MYEIQTVDKQGMIKRSWQAERECREQIDHVVPREFSLRSRLTRPFAQMASYIVDKLTAKRKKTAEQPITQIKATGEINSEQERRNIAEKVQSIPQDFREPQPLFNDKTQIQNVITIDASMSIPHPQPAFRSCINLGYIGSQKQMDEQAMRLSIVSRMEMPMQIHPFKPIPNYEASDLIKLPPDIRAVRQFLRKSRKPKHRTSKLKKSMNDMRNELSEVIEVKKKVQKPKRPLVLVVKNPAPKEPPKQPQKQPEQPVVGQQPVIVPPPTNALPASGFLSTIAPAAPLSNIFSAGGLFPTEIKSSEGRPDTKSVEFKVPTPPVLKRPLSQQDIKPPVPAPVSANFENSGLQTPTKEPPSNEAEPPSDKNTPIKQPLSGEDKAIFDANMKQGFSSQMIDESEEQSQPDNVSASASAVASATKDDKKSALPPGLSQAAAAFLNPPASLRNQTTLEALIKQNNAKGGGYKLTPENLIAAKELFTNLTPTKESPQKNDSIASLFPPAGSSPFFQSPVTNQFGYKVPMGTALAEFVQVPIEQNPFVNKPNQVISLFSDPEVKKPKKGGRKNEKDRVGW